MSISQIIKKYHKNRIENIRKMSNGIDKNMAIGSFVADLGKGSIKPVANAIGSCFRKVKKCYLLFTSNSMQMSLEFRGRQSIIKKYPKLKNDIEKIIENYKIVDSHFKTETLFISLDPQKIITELVINYNYPTKFACYNTIAKTLKEMGYKYHKIQKSEIIDRIPETDKIFENVNDCLESINITNDATAAISVDDKTSKKIGNFSDNGYSWTNIKALDHDTIFEYSVKPFGILDLKTNETFVTCTTYNSTAEFKVDCIEKYVIKKNKKQKLKKLIIFLDNGPENSSRRRLWLKKLVYLSKKYNLVIQLVYYPPYCSKYNKIERVWARVQMTWRRITMNSLDILMECLNKITWNNVKMKGYLSTKEYEKGIKISDYEMETKINQHIIREEGLEKWSVVIESVNNFV